MIKIASNVPRTPYLRGDVTTREVRRVKLLREWDGGRVNRNAMRDSIQ
jgi:hypothetical protein